MAIVTNVGTGCGGRGSVGARGRDRRAVVTVSGHGAPDERRLNAFIRILTGSTWLVEVFGDGSCVRQNRVVLAPVAGVKPSEVFGSPTGLR